MNPSRRNILHGTLAVGALAPLPALAMHDDCAAIRERIRLAAAIYDVDPGPALALTDAQLMDEDRLVRWAMANLPGIDWNWLFEGSVASLLRAGRDAHSKKRRD